MKWFENDVKMYGTQTFPHGEYVKYRFENDVKMYGTQTANMQPSTKVLFENDVKMYGTQTTEYAEQVTAGLRMM